LQPSWFQHLTLARPRLNQSAARWRGSLLAIAEPALPDALCRLRVGAVAVPAIATERAAEVDAVDPPSSRAVEVTVRFAVPAKLPAAAVSVRFASCAGVSVQLPSAFSVPAESVATLGAPVMMTSSGENFWRGNNADATGTSLSLDGVPVLEKSDPAFQARVRNLDELGQMRLFWAESWRFWRESPGAALALTARKVYYFYAFPPTAGLWYAGWMLYAYVVYYALEIIAVVAGLRAFVVTRPTTSLASAFQRWLPLITVVSGGLVQSAFFVESRHRWGVEPLLLVFAAPAVCAVGDLISRRRDTKSTTSAAHG